MRPQEKILTYLSVYGKAHKYKIARQLKIDVNQVTNVLSKLRDEGKIEIKNGNSILKKGKKLIIAKAKKRKKQPKEEPEESKEELSGESVKEEQSTEISEETPTEEERETFGQKPEGEVEERIEGTVKFFNPNKGFGFVTGDDGKEYYIHESSLKEGVTIEADDRVSFKVVQEAQGQKAEEVEKIGQSMGEEK